VSKHGTIVPQPVVPKYAREVPIRVTPSRQLVSPDPDWSSLPMCPTLRLVEERQRGLDGQSQLRRRTLY
jgi:hypothetical protein